ncbi:MAG: hypothetical protein WCK02_16725, partial [Bacteroidota bacterium]
MYIKNANLNLTINKSRKLIITNYFRLVLFLVFSIYITNTATAQCTYSICVTNAGTFGTGTVNVKVNGTPVAGATSLTDGCVDFTVTDGATILITYTTSGFGLNCYYIVTSGAGGAGSVVYTSGYPGGISTAPPASKTITVATPCAVITPTNFGPLQAPCTNLDFENGFTGWYGTTGTVSIGTAVATSPIYVPVTLNTTTGTQFIVNTTGTDTYGGFPKVYPSGGTKSVRLGTDVTGNNGTSLEQYFSVTSANSSFTYNYALVLQAGVHGDNEQPFFKAEFYDENGATISCGDYLVVAPGSGFTQCSSPTDVYYKGWTTVTVDLSANIGSNVHVKFTVGSCAQTAHMGYAYLDCSCSAFVDLNNQTICAGQSATLTAPVGAASYTWSPAGIPGGNTNTITVSPVTTSTYSCAMTTIGTSICNNTLNATVTVNSNPILTVSNDGPICGGQTLNLNIAQSGYTSYSWTGPDNFTSALQNPTIPNSTNANSGTYNVTATLGTCTATGSTDVTIGAGPIVNPIPNITVCNGETIATSAFGSPSAGATFDWTNSNTAIIPSSNGTGNIPSFTAVNNGTIPISTTISVTASLSGCTGLPTTYTITINPDLVVDLGQDVSICPNTSTQLSASPNNASSYTWTSNPASIISSIYNPTVTPTATTTYSIKVDNNGCTGTDDIIVTIRPLPSISAGNDVSICKNTSTQLGASGGSTYTWTSTPASVVP